MDPRLISNSREEHPHLPHHKTQDNGLQTDCEFPQGPDFVLLWQMLTLAKMSFILCFDGKIGPFKRHNIFFLYRFDLSIFTNIRNENEIKLGRVSDFALLRRVSHLNLYVQKWLQQY